MTLLGHVGAYLHVMWCDGDGDDGDGDGDGVKVGECCGCVEV